MNDSVVLDSCLLISFVTTFPEFLHLSTQYYAHACMFDSILQPPVVWLDCMRANTKFSANLQKVVAFSATILALAATTMKYLFRKDFLVQTANWFWSSEGFPSVESEVDTEERH